MNYLAHLFLSRPTDEHRIGSILADFTVGTIGDLKNKYGIPIAVGIKHHREIDKYTDSHPAVMRSVKVLHSGYGPYSGIIVDVVYDHYLLKYWDRFTDQSKESFFTSIYQSLDRWDWDFPPRYCTTIARLVEKKWLTSYHEIEMVAYALSRIGERFPRETPLGNTLVGLKTFYRELEEDFLAFFPELMEFSQKVKCPV